MLKSSLRTSDPTASRLLPAAPPAHIVRRGSPFEEPRLFLVGITLLIGIFVFWASAAPIDRVVRVEGTVIPAARSQKIQHLEGGIVASIDTTEGAIVKRGDLLMSIDDTLANAGKQDADEKLNDARLRVARLEAETQGKETVSFPSDLAKLSGASAEQDLFVARRKKLNDEIAVHLDTIRQRESDITQAQQQDQSLNAEMVTAQQRYTMEQTMAAQNAASQMEVLEAQSRVQRLKTEMSGVEASIPKYRGAIAEEQSRIQAAKADFDSHAHDDLVSALEDIERFKQLSTTASDRLKRTELRSPIDGVVNHIEIHTVGGVVKPGETLIEITPGTDQILIEARVDPRNRGYLRAGLDAQVRVSAYDTNELGPLKGQVTEVGSDSLTDTHGAPYYQINVLVKSVPPSYANHAIMPGMTATADIVTGRRKVLSYLLSPVSQFTFNMFKDPR